MADWADWSEDEYLQYLHDERRRFAWVMQRYGGLSATQAETAAVRHYAFEASDAPYRGLVFHDDAWHWAMLEIYGEGYWIQHPDLAEPQAEYRALD
ncbi:hypothetical protein [Micromonospora trifolii]|uniref:hypothetical protein n=1 Tax=Micromonospora trifolii TaxID=2911208 RepID=UPI003CEAAC44